MGLIRAGLVDTTKESKSDLIRKGLVGASAANRVCASFPPPLLNALGGDGPLFGIKHELLLEANGDACVCGVRHLDQASSCRFR